MNLTSAGIGSGLDLESIIEAYVNAEAIPTEIRLQNKQDILTTELSGVSQFKSALSSFESALKQMSDVSDFNKQVITASTDDITVTSNGYASNGTFSIEVEQLAQGSRVQSASFASSTDTVGTGTLTFTAGADTFDVDIDGADNLSAIRDKINAQSENFGVTANIINSDSGSYLVYRSEISGDSNNLSVTTSDSSLDDISTNTTQDADDVAKSAKVYVDGNLVTQDTNEFKNIIEDVTFVAQNENLGSPTVVTISQDEDNGTTLINNFVNAFNTLRYTLDSLGNAETGELAFDANVRQVKSQLNAIVGDSVSGVSGSLSRLDEIGITLNKDGLLEISSVGIGDMDSGTEKLSSALSDRLSEVGEIFASDDGVATNLLTMIDSYNGSDGTLSLRSTTLNASLANIPDEYETLETRLRDYEDTLRSKFTFLDQTVSLYSSTGDWLSSTLKSLSPSSD